MSLFILLQGCDSNRTNLSQTNSPVPSSENTDIGKNSSITLKEIIGNEASREQKQTPDEAVINQIQWKMSNDKIISASKQNIIGSSTFGKNSLVITKLPETTLQWYNFVILTNKDQKWDLSGVIDMPIAKTLNNDKRGLALPMEEFATASLARGGSAKNDIWAFANDNKYVVIGKYPREPIEPDSGTDNLILGERKAWIKTEVKNSFIFYFDKEYLVWISGNLTKDEMINLVNSFPPVETEKFPIAN